VYFLELGGEDDAFAAREAATAATGVDRVAPALAVAGSVDAARVRGLAYTHRAGELLARTDADVASARAALAAAPLDRTGSVAVRARDVRGGADVSTQATERELGAVLVERGFSVDLDDPDHVLRAYFSGDVCLLGWQTVESVRDFGDRKPTSRPFFQPGGMDPLDARALANLAGSGPGTRILDPMCGTGGTLIEAGLVGSDVVGSDAQWKMARGALENLAAFLDGGYATVRADATALPFRDDAFDGVVFDAPYGRQSKVASEGVETLTSGALAEARRVAPRAVVVADRPLTAAAREAGWTVDAEFERPVHRSLVRHVHVLTD
jgi:tRNA (guanine10-N2)-dimethyltransferase